MSYIAAVLLLEMDDYQALCCLSTLLNGKVVQEFIMMNTPAIDQYWECFSELFHEFIPDLAKHFSSICLTCDLFLLDWFMTLFAKSLPLEQVGRIWDVMITESESFLLRASLGILLTLKDSLINVNIGPCKKMLGRIPTEASIPLRTLTYQ